MQNIPTLTQSYASNSPEIFKQPVALGDRNSESNTIQGHRRLPKRDPPGQQCVYIPPGDHRKESYRLSTYICFKNNHISIFDLAESGFYYTGYKDRTKCFSCGNNVEGWTSRDSPSDVKFHDGDCPITTGRDFQNVASDRTQFRNFLKHQVRPNATCSIKTQIATGNSQQSANIPVSNQTSSTSIISSHHTKAIQLLPKLKLARIYDHQHEETLKTLDVCKEEDRRKSFAKWPAYPAPYLPSALAQEGFFYLGNLDRVQCFSCSGVLRNWAPSDDVKQQHRTHFSACRLHDGSDPRNIRMTADQRARADIEDAEKLSSLLPNGNVSEPPDPSPEEQRYLEENLPCNAPTNPHMSNLRGRIESYRTWPTGKTKATAEQLAKAGMFYLGELDKTKCFYCNGGLQNWDYNDEPFTEHAKWFPGCEFVNRCKGLRFVRNLSDAHPNLKRPSIRNGMSIRQIPDFQDSRSQDQPTCSREAPSQETATKSVYEGGETTEVRHRENPHASQQERHQASQNDEETSLMQNFREVREAMFCRNCKTNKSDTLFLPCGHVVSCSSCASRAQRCIACSSLVKENMKVYRS